MDSQLTWTSGAIGPRDSAPEQEDQPETFEPPVPEPLPSLDAAAKAAWIGALGGPGYLMAATIMNWQTPTWIAAGCALAGLCGFGYLVSRLKPHRDDDDDDNLAPERWFSSRRLCFSSRRPRLARLAWRTWRGRPRG